MKDDAGSNKESAIPTRESLIEQHPDLYNIFLILALISLVGLVIFLLSDVISFGQDASHKGLLEDIHSQKTIASEFILFTNQTDDVLKTISLGVKPVIGLIYAGSSSLSEEKSGKSLSASNVSDNSGNRTARKNAVNTSNSSPNSSLLSSIPVSAINNKKKASIGSGYAISAYSSGDSSSEGSSSKGRLHHCNSGSASSKESSETASGINKSLQGQSKLSGSTPIQSVLNSSQVAGALDDMQLNQSLRNNSQQNRSETSNLSAGISHSGQSQPTANSSLIGGKILKTDQIGSKDTIDGISTLNISSAGLPSETSASEAITSFSVVSNNSSAGHVAAEGIHADETASSITSTNNTTASSSNDILPGLYALKSDAQNLSISANRPISARDISMQMNESRILITPPIHYEGGNAADASKDVDAGNSADHFVVKSLKFKSNNIDKGSSDTAKPPERKSKSISSASSSSKSKDSKKTQLSKRNKVIQGSKRPIRPDRPNTNKKSNK
jgi:hypothetical protein